MKGKNTFTIAEIAELKKLIGLRNLATRSEQKKIRARMRRIGFYGKADWGINNCQVSDLESLVRSGQITVTGANAQTATRNPASVTVTAQHTTLPPEHRSARAKSDEFYVLALCDEVMGMNSLRQHRFEFLRGDQSSDGKPGVKLPVDAYFPEKHLVVEYRERQHTEAVLFFDKPDWLTRSGIPRSEQRRKYDLLRETVLPQHGIALCIISCDQFLLNTKKRIARDYANDITLVKRILKPYK